MNTGYAVIQCDLRGGQTSAACMLVSWARYIVYYIRALSPCSLCATLQSVAENEEEFKANASSRKEYKMEGAKLENVKVEAVIV